MTAFSASRWYHIAAPRRVPCRDPYPLGTSGRSGRQGDDDLRSARGRGERHRHVLDAVDQMTAFSADQRKRPDSASDQPKRLLATTHHYPPVSDVLSPSVSRRGRCSSTGHREPTATPRSSRASTRVRSGPTSATALNRVGSAATSGPKGSPSWSALEAASTRARWSPKRDVVVQPTSPAVASSTIQRAIAAASGRPSPVSTGVGPELQPPDRPNLSGREISRWREPLDPQQVFPLRVMEVSFFGSVLDGSLVVLRRGHEGGEGGRPLTPAPFTPFCTLPGVTTSSLSRTYGVRRP